MSGRKLVRPRGADRITYEEAAKILKVGKSTVYEWVRIGYLDAYETNGGYHKLSRRIVLQMAHDRNKS